MMSDTQERRGSLPRLSRLPVPRSASGIPRLSTGDLTTSSLRPRASRDSLSADSPSPVEVHNPKLRSSLSHSHLRASNSGELRKPSVRHCASREQLRPKVPVVKSEASVAVKPTRVASGTKRWSTTNNNPPLQYKPAEKRAGDRASQADELPELLLTSYLNGTLGSPDLPEDHDTNASGDYELPTLTDKPKPSLSERTVETLAQIPSSPAMRKKSASFFDQGRPASRTDSTGSRPGSSYNSEGFGLPMSPDGTSISSFRSSTHSFKKPSNARSHSPDKSTSSLTSPLSSKLRSLNNRSSFASLPRASTFADVRSMTPDKDEGKPLSRSGTTKSLNPKRSSIALAKKPSTQALHADEEPMSPSSTGWDGIIGANTQATEKQPEISSSRKSSTTLRDHIAKAKAAKRAAMAQMGEGNASFANAEVSGFGGSFGDPFNLNQGADANGNVLKRRIANGRTTGKLNIAALGLKEIPSEVMKMYEYESLQSSGGNWAESVDLTRLIAADNELEELGDAILPDFDPEAVNDEDEPQGNIFGGLETMDVHGNRLTGLPIGLRRLQNLTSLNLSNNCLTNEALNVLESLSGLRDLKLANNKLEGPLNTCITSLSSLEILDLHGNKVSALPSDIDSLSRLRILNLSENSFESLPFAGLAKLPLTELNLKKNKLTGTLIEESVESLPLLQTFDVSVNQLVHLVSPGSTIRFPVVHTLLLSMNRLQELPDMTSWTHLLTVTADTNNISVIPEGFTSLEKLRQADFSSNDLRVLPPEISRMEGLTLLSLSGNPLREKRFSSSTTEEIKNVLASRLEPPPPYQDPASEASIAEAMNNLEGLGKDEEDGDEGHGSDGEDDFKTPPTSRPQSPNRSRANTATEPIWPVKPGGLLDRSRTESTVLDPEMCARVAAMHQVQQAQLHHNLFACFPKSLKHFSETLTSLALAHNQMVGETYLAEELVLPALKELNLTSNHITSLGPLTKFLRASHLQKIDVSMNRLSALPPDLKQTFPMMIALLASNNHLVELDPASIKGLQVVDVSSNDIAHLDPRIGLLGGRAGLKKLEVTGNRFRVPRWNILEQGTGATLQWLRGRVAAADMDSWKAENGEEDFNDVD